VYGHDNYIYKKMGRSGNMYGTTRFPSGTHCPNPVTFQVSSIAADIVSIQSDSRNIHPEFLADHTDIPNWHCINMMPVHGACAPIQLTALVQINYFATYKFRG